MMPQKLLSSSLLDATVSFEAASSQSPDLTTYTYSSVALGAAAGNRKIVIAVMGQAVNRTISSITVAGISASAVVSVSNAFDLMALWQVDVPTGTSGDVVVTWSGGQDRCAIGVWALYGASSAANDTDTDTGTSSVSGTIAVPAGGVAIGAAQSQGSSTAAISGTGITPNFNQSVDGPARQGGGSGAYADAEASLTITGTTTGSASGRALGVFASWGRA